MTEPSDLSNEEMLCLLTDYLLGLRYQSPDRLRSILCEVFEYLNQEAEEEGEAIEEDKEGRKESEESEESEKPSESEPKKPTPEEEARTFFEEEGVVSRPEPNASEQRTRTLRNLVQDRLVAKPSIERQNSPVAKPSSPIAKQFRPALFAYPNPQGRTIGTREPALPTLRKNLNIGNPDKMLGSVKSASKTCMSCRGGL